MKYVAVIERAKDGGYWAYLPDLPGCVSAGDTREEAERNVRAAVEMHLESLRDHGEPIPQPTASVTTVDAA